MVLILHKLMIRIDSFNTSSQVTNSPSGKLFRSLRGDESHAVILHGIANLNLKRQIL